MDSSALMLLSTGGDAAMPLPREALPVPITPQDTDYSCGAAAVLACLRYYGVDDEQDEAALYDALGTTEDNGTAPTFMADALNAHGLAANYRNDITADDLRDAVRERVPVILDIQGALIDDGEYHGHYVVLVGIDSRRIYFMDPATGSYQYLPIGDFMDRWFDVEGERGGIFVMGRDHAPLIGWAEQATAERMR